MEKTNKRIFATVLCAILLSSTLASCSSTQNEKLPNTSTNQNQQSTQEAKEDEKSEALPNSPTQNTDGTNQNIEIDTYKEQISYYMNLTESLQADLLKLKEESYIAECEYQLQVKTLEQTVQDLRDVISSISSGDINVSIPPSGNDAPSNDQISSRVEFKYETNNGEVTITEYTGSSLDVKIPSTLNGCPVTSIGESAFKSKQVRSVIIPSGVTLIDWFAFSGCTSLETITIPSSVTSVQHGAFELCPRSLIIKCRKGSYIEAYALSWGMNVEAK